MAARRRPPGLATPPPCDPTGSAASPARYTADRHHPGWRLAVPGSARRSSARPPINRTACVLTGDEAGVRSGKPMGRASARCPVPEMLARSVPRHAAPVFAAGQTTAGPTPMPAADARCANVTRGPGRVSLHQGFQSQGSPLNWSGHAVNAGRPRWSPQHLRRLVVHAPLVERGSSPAPRWCCFGFFRRQPVVRGQVIRFVTLPVMIPA